MTALGGGVLEPGQAASILKAAAARGTGIGAFVRLALVSGARRGELLILRWPDLARPESGDGCGTLDVTCLDGGKTKYSRRIALDPGTMDLLEAWRRETAGSDGRGYVFANGRDGERAWNPAWLSRQVIRASAQTGVSASVTGLRRYFHGPDGHARCPRGRDRAPPRPGRARRPDVLVGGVEHVMRQKHLRLAVNRLELVCHKFRLR